MLLARATFSNTADSVDELSFQQGDVLILIEKNVTNMDGWWLCSFHGQVGLAPANRLRLFASNDFVNQQMSSLFDKSALVFVNINC